VPDRPPDLTPPPPLRSPPYGLVDFHEFKDYMNGLESKGETFELSCP